MSYFKDLSSYNKTLSVGESITVIVPTAHGDGYSVSYQAVDSNSNPISNEALTYDLCGSGLKPATTSSSPSGGTISSGSYPLRNRTDTSDNRRTLVFGEAVARVTKDVNTAEKTWTYHPYLINSAEKDGVKIGAFDQANTFTPSTAPDGVIIETLRESAEVGGTDRYSIGADGFTFGNETNNNSISLRTTSETDWNPNNGFKSIIKRGATGKSMISFASPEKSFTLQNIILDGNYSDETGSPQYECRNDTEGGTPYSGGLVNSTGTLNIDEGTVMQNTRTVGDGGAVAMSQGTTVNVNNASFNNCISTKRGGALFAGTLAGIQDASDESVIYGVTITGDISDGHTGTSFTNCVSNCAYPKNTAGADGGGGALFLSENSKSLTIKNPTKNKGEGLVDRPANYENSINNTDPGAQFVQDNYWKTYNENPNNPFNPGVIFSDCSVQGNLLEKGGGAILSRVSVDISNCRFERCETIRVRSANSDSGSPALPGGAVLLKRAVVTPSYTITARIDNCYFLECKSRSSGGAVEADTASDNDVNKDKDSLTIENCKFYRCITKEKDDLLSFDSGNYKGGGALGIYKYGDITVKNSNISECKGSTGGGYGGAIRFSSNSITLYNTIIDSCGRATAGKNNASDQGGAIGTASGTVNMGKCTIQNCEAKSGGAVYLSNSTLNIGLTTDDNDPEKRIVRSYNTIKGNTADKGAGIYITKSKVCIAKNNNFGGADVVVDSNGNQVVNEETMSMFNYAKGAIANNQYNGTLKYTKPRQDIYIADWAGPNSSSPSNNPPIRVDGEITSGNGTIWVWLDDTCTQNSTKVGKQFAAFNSYNVRSDLGDNVARTVESFRNARTDTDSKNKTGDYIRGSVKLENEVTPQEWSKIKSCIFWTGHEDTGRRVVLRKVVKNGNHFSSKTGSATFTVYESDYTVNNPTSPISVGENGTQLSNLALKNGGVIYVGEMPYGEYLIKESNGTWYFLIVHEKGVYVDDQLNTNVSEHGGFTGNTQADAINNAKADLNRAKAAYNLN